MKKKILSIALSACLILTMAPAAFATGSDVDSSNDGGSIVLDKRVDSTGTSGNESFKLTLESYATGAEGSIEEVPTPSDIVLVLDESGSMNDCIECNHEIEGDNNGALGVTTKGNVLNSADANNTVLFTGHKVFGSDIWTYKEYRIIYPDDGSTRVVKYCEEHKGWYSTDHNASGLHTGAKWVPFTKSGQTPTNNKNVAGENTTKDRWVCEVQFYCVCDHDTQRVDALKNALNGFLNEVHEDSVKDDIDNRIAIVTYGDASNTALCYTDDTAAANGTNWNAARAFKSITTEAQREDLLKIVEDKVSVRSATPTHVGIQAAESIFAANPIPNDVDRNRVMILFTDGAPGSDYAFYDGKYSSTQTADWTNPGIASAKRIKNTYGATVYTVGLFPGADASTPSSLPKHTSGKEGSGQHNEAFFDNANRFLHLVSSNYPNAESMTSTGSVASLDGGEGYYLSAEDEKGLYEIFDALSKVTEPSSTTVTLGKKTVVTDVVTDYFTIPEVKGKASVTAWTETFTGYKANGEMTWSKDADSVSAVGDESASLDVVVTDRIVKVTNFDFAEQYVSVNKNEDGSDVPRGKKLVVEINIIPNEDFLGGNDVPTNKTSDSGIYTETGDLVENFPTPEPVDVKVKTIKPQAVDGYIYLSQAAEIPHVASVGEFTVAGVYEGDGVTPKVFSVDGINNAYVDITYTVKDGEKSTSCTVASGTKSADIEESWSGTLNKSQVLSESKHYEVICDVKSTNDASNNSNASDEAAIYVYKPEITFRDSEMELGQKADYATQNYVSVTWKNNGEAPEGDALAKLGAAPALQFEYSPTEDKFLTDAPVTVTKVVSPAKAASGEFKHAVPNELDLLTVKDGVLFFREACDFCGHEGGVVAEGEENFIVHVSTFDLTITKTGIAQPLDDDGLREIDADDAEYQSTIFTVTCVEDPSFAMDVVVHGNGSVTIEGLRVGTYKVVEDTAWSWRYTPEKSEITVDTGDVVDGKASVAFDNDRTKTKWLSGDNWCANLFAENAITQITGALNAPAGN